MMARMSALALLLSAWVGAASVRLSPMDHLNNLDWTVLVASIVP